MRLRFAVIILASTAFTPAIAADIAAQSRIDAVTVFPSGAEVVRIAQANIDAGENTLIFSDLPGNLQVETLRVEGTSSGKIEIGSVDSRTVAVPSAATDAQRKKIESDIETLQDERTVLDQTISDAEYQKSLMQQLATNVFTPPPKESEAKPFGPADLGGLLDLVGGKLQTLSKLILDSRVRQRAIDRQIGDLSNELQRLAPQDGQRIMVTVHLAAPVATAGTFKLKYRIAEAGWRPIYDARLVSPEKNTKAKIELVRRADVMQSTTESWNGVALTLSTARPLGATAAPDLWPAQIAAFDGGRGANYARPADMMDAAKPATMPEESLQSSVRKEDDVAQSQAEVEIAGFQALYSIAGRVSVDNTGTAKKVRIDTSELEAQLTARAVPKLDPNAYLMASFTLNGETPLLPGTVMLYRDGVFMGQGDLPLLAPGEEAKLGFGADDLIKVKRVEVKRMTGEEGLISTSAVETRAYDITVKNLHDFAVPVTILDQMPFSTWEEITVETLAGMTAPSIRDFEKKRGVLAWNLDVEPKAEALIKHGFKVTMPQDLKVGMNIN
ncbi:MAG: mucoidy inhibitor MuiA family protein [Rhizobiales bacterium]|nr:mucoidy inhibitor MuiA family protein [Hyphomicrobiales bacterium]